MRYRYKFLVHLVWIIACLVLFHVIYRHAKETAIVDINERQMIHGKQAVKGIEGYFDSWINLLTSTARGDSIIDLNELGKNQMCFIQENNPEGIKGITRVDQQGRIVHTIPYDSKLIGTDLSDQEHIKEVIRSRKPVLGGIFTAVQGFRGIALHVPVFQGGEFRGTLGVLLDFERIPKRFLQDIVIGKEGYAWMLNKDGIEIYCPVPGHTGNSVFENCRDFPTIISMAREMLKGRQGVTTYLFDQVREEKTSTVRKHAVYLPVRVANTFWSIAVTTSEDEILSSLRDFRNELIAVVVVLLLGSLLFAYYAMKAWGIVREERKRQSAEKALRESEERFRQIVENADAGYFYIDLEGKFRDVNKAWLKLHKYETPEEILGKHYSTTQVEDDLEEARRIVEDILHGGRFESGEFTRRCKDGSIGYHTFSARPAFQGGVAAGVEGFVIDTTERRVLEGSFEESQARFQSLFRSMNEGMVLHKICYDEEEKPVDYIILEVNVAFEKITGITREMAVGRKGSELYGTGTAPLLDIYAQVALTGEPITFETTFDPMRKTFLISCFSPRRGQFATVFENVTARKQQENEREIAIGFLRLVNESKGIEDLIHKVTDFLQQKSGCEAVGIRLRRGHDYPYYETRGFPKEFVLLENRLCASDTEGRPILDDTFNPILECMCGNVICGRFDPSKPFFTEKGSFWSNNTTELLATTTEADRQARTRNRCNGEGYESVALIPLRVGDERLGLLQLNDKREGRFTPEFIALWERLADYLAVALSKLLAETALQESETTYRSLFENMLNGFAYCRMHFDDHGTPSDFTYLAVNSAFETLTGLKDVAGKKVSEVIPGIREADPELLERYGRVAKTGSPERFEMFVKALQMWFSISVYSPKREHFVAVFDVINERKRAEEALRKSEEIARRSATDSRAMAEIGRIINSSLDMEEVYERFAEEVRKLIPFDRISINPVNLKDDTISISYCAGIETLERPKGAILPLTGSLGEHILSLRKSLLIRTEEMEDYARRFPSLLPSLQSGIQSLIGVPLISKGDGIGILYIRSTKANAYSERDLVLAERVGYYISSSVANSRLYEEQRRAEDALRESEARYRLLSENSADVIWTLDLASQRFSYVSPSVEKLRGYTPQEVMAQPLEEVLTTESLRMVTDLLPRRLAAFQGGDESMRVWTNELDQPRKDGSIVHTEVATTLLTNAQGQVTEILGVTRDITNRKNAEEEREKLQAQFLQAQKMESVGRLAGGVAHDFNNMIGIIMGNAEMAALQVSPDDPVQECLQEILKASYRSADTARQLLAFARKQTINPKVLDLNDTISGMLKMLQRLIGEDIDLGWHPGHVLWNVKTDPSQVNQILANLTVNARDAIAGVGKVTIETGNVTLDEACCKDQEGFLPGEYVLLAVSDSGTGMDKEVLEHLFEPFFTTKGIGKGTGLGLSTVYGIVKQNNGFVNVYSEPGKGTTFKIYLPRFQAGPLETDGEKKPEKLPRGTETVLIVEDEGSILRVGKLMLETLGYIVLTATTPGEAVKMAKENGGLVNLLLTDVVMPEMNGRELAERLKEIHPGLKCLYMSGYTADVIAHHGVLEEGVIFIQKPFSTQDLAFKVREALDLLG